MSQKLLKPIPLANFKKQLIKESCDVTSMMDFNSFGHKCHVSLFKKIYANMTHPDLSKSKLHDGSSNGHNHFNHLTYASLGVNLAYILNLDVMCDMGLFLIPRFIKNIIETLCNFNDIF